VELEIVNSKARRARLAKVATAQELSSLLKEMMKLLVGLTLMLVAERGSGKMLEPSDVCQ
jgi:hypothetical protein